MGTLNGASSQFYLSRWNYASDCASGKWTRVYPSTAPSETSGAILPGNGVNLIAVARSGNTITLSANGQQLARVTDLSPGLPPVGYLGLASSAGPSGFSSASSFDSRFDNLSFQASSVSTSSLQSVSSRGETSPRLVPGR